MIEPILSASAIRREYSRGDNEAPLEVLRGVDLEIQRGEAVSIVGASGAGKSTLLHILATLDRPSSGSLQISGARIESMDDEQLSQFRNARMGFVFQFHHLLSEFSALENVMMPLRIQGQSAKVARVAAERGLVRLGLQDRLNHFPNSLSGGELQRVAIARALVCEPELLLADEPTGNLDEKSAKKIQELFFELQVERGLTLIVVTHDLDFAKSFGRCLRMADGRWASA